MVGTEMLHTVKSSAYGFTGVIMKIKINSGILIIQVRILFYSAPRRMAEVDIKKLTVMYGAVPNFVKTRIPAVQGLVRCSYYIRQRTCSANAWLDAHVTLQLQHGIE